MRPAVHRHHVFFGQKQKKHSTKYGLLADLCYDCHEGQNGVHNNYTADLELKQRYQEIYEDTFSHESFMRIFGRNYLEVEE
jgi:hypothetical protein